MIADLLRLSYRRLRVRAHLHRNDALGALHRAWAYVHATRLAGDYYEFGVYRGNSLANAFLSYRYVRRRAQGAAGRRHGGGGTVAAFLADRPLFYGFDSFTGVPDNLEGDDGLAAGSFRASRAEAERSCRIVGLRAPDLVLVPGPFADNAGAVGNRPAAIVHLDCDLYASARDALALVGDRLVQGSVLLCDDYDLFQADPGRGERRALAEFAARRGVVLEPWFAYGAASRAFLWQAAPCAG